MLLRLLRPAVATHHLRLLCSSVAAHHLWLRLLRPAVTAHHLRLLCSSVAAHHLWLRLLRPAVTAHHLRLLCSRIAAHHLWLRPHGIDSAPITQGCALIRSGSGELTGEMRLPHFRSGLLALSAGLGATCRGSAPVAARRRCMERTLRLFGTLSARSPRLLDSALAWRRIRRMRGGVLA